MEENIEAKLETIGKIKEIEDKYNKRKNWILGLTFAAIIGSSWSGVRSYKIAEDLSHYNPLVKYIEVYRGLKNTRAILKSDGYRDNLLAAIERQIQTIEQDPEYKNGLELEERIEKLRKHGAYYHWGVLGSAFFGLIFLGLNKVKKEDEIKPYHKKEDVLNRWKVL